jgi:murein DD-endopeptidase MepM/ murein hydrolase activator NlpD
MSSTSLKFTEYPITEKFKEVDSLHPNGHSGIDFATPMNTEVQCIEDAIVEKIYNDNYSGLTLTIKLDEDNVMSFCHLNSVKVKQGDSIQSGQIIAYTGNSGEHTTGSHIHVTMRKDNVLTDPLPYLMGEHSNISSNNSYIGLIMLVLILFLIWKFKKIIFIGICGLIVLMFLILVR